MQTACLKYMGRMNGLVRQGCPDRLKQSSVCLRLLIQSTEAGVAALIRPLAIFTFLQFQEIHAELSPIGTLMFVHSSVLLSLLSRKSLDLPSAGLRLGDFIGWFMCLSAGLVNS